MREASFILPTHGNEGEDLADIHNAVVSTLIEHFGGCSRTLTQGTWRSPQGHVFNDKGVRYTVAAEWSVSEAQAFDRIVVLAGRLSRQEAIYVVDELGDVEIRDMT